MPPNPKAVVPPYQLPGQPLPPGTAEATQLGDPTPRPALNNCKSHRQKGLCLKTKALGLLKDPSFGLGSCQLCMGKHSYVLALPPPAIIIHYCWGQDVAQRDFQSMQSFKVSKFRSMHLYVPT